MAIFKDGDFVTVEHDYNGFTKGKKYVVMNNNGCLYVNNNHDFPWSTDDAYGLFVPWHKPWHGGENCTEKLLDYLTGLVEAGDHVVYIEKVLNILDMKIVTKTTYTVERK